MNDFDKMVLDAMREAMNKAITEKLGGYNSPLQKMVEDVVARNRDTLVATMDDAFKSVIRTEAFKAGIIEEFEHKVARQLVSKLDGSVEKAVNDLRSNASFRAKMTLAIEALVNEARSAP